MLQPVRNGAGWNCLSKAEGVEHLPFVCCKTLLVGQCQWQPRHGVRVSLLFPGRGPRSPCGATADLFLLLQPHVHPHLSMDLALQGALSSHGPVLAPPTICILFLLKVSPKQPNLICSSLPRGGTHTVPKSL